MTPLMSGEAVASSARLDTAVAEFTECTQMAPSIAAAYGSDTLSLYRTGLLGIDRPFEEEFVDHRVGALGHLTTLWGEVFGSQAYFTELHGYVRAVIRGKASVVRSAGIKLPRSQGEMRDGYNGTLEVIQQDVPKGLGREPVIYPVLGRLQLIYGVESPSVWEDEAFAADPTYAQAINDMFGEAPPAIALQDVAARLREQQGADLSQETLDARFANFVGLAQMSLMSVIAEDLQTYAVSGNPGRTKRAGKLARGYAGEFTRDDLLRKQEILFEIAELCAKDASEISKNARARGMLSGIRARAYNTAINVDEFLQFFINVYGSLGHELPSLLVKITTEETPVPVAAPVRVRQPLGAVALDVAAARQEQRDDDTKVVMAPPKSHVSPEIAADIAKRCQVLQTGVIAYQGRWILSPSARKREGFAGLPSRLMEGRRFTDTALLDPLIIDRQGLSDAEGITDVIVTLNRLARQYKPDEALREVDASLEQRRQLLADYGVLCKYAKDQGCSLPLSSLALPNIEKYMQQIANNWRAFSRLLAEACPGHNPTELCGRLWRVLPPPEPTSSYSTTNPYSYF